MLHRKVLPYGSVVIYSRINLQGWICTPEMGRLQLQVVLWEIGVAAGELTATQCPMCGEITGDMEAAAECVEVICRECMIRYY